MIVGYINILQTFLSEKFMMLCYSRNVIRSFVAVVTLFNMWIVFDIVESSFNVIMERSGNFAHFEGVEIQNVQQKKAFVV